MTVLKSLPVFSFGTLKIKFCYHTYDFMHDTPDRQRESRALPISLSANYTVTACSRLLKQPISITQPIITPIMRGRLLADIFTEIPKCYYHRPQMYFYF